MTKICLVLAALAIGCVPPTALAQPGAYEPAAFAGTYVAQGGSITLEQAGDRVTGTARVGALVASVEGVVQGGQLRGVARTSAGQSYFTAYASAEGLQLALDGGQPVFLARSAAGTPNATPAGAPAAPVVDGPPPPAIASAAAIADPYRDEVDGWEVRTPAGWKHGVKDGQLAFGGMTEAGVILVNFHRGVTYDQLRANVGAQVARLGATQTGPVREDTVAGGRALVVELTGTSAEGPLAGRAIGIAGPGGVVTVLGVTTQSKLAALRARVDAIARSARFFEPRVTIVQNLVGPWWHYHSVGSGLNSASYERTIELCADGTFHDSDESVISAHAENKNPSSDHFGSSTSAGRASQGNGAGRWTATGDDLAGTLRLVHANGNVEQHRYVFKKRNGGDIELDGRWYGRAPDKGGRCR